MKKLTLFVLLLMFSITTKSQTVDPVEYATGTLSAQEQLFSYQLPRFKPGNTLNRNFIWFGLEYFSDMFQPGNTNQQAFAKSKTNNIEFYTNWNYYFMVSSNIGSFSGMYNDTVNYFNGAMVNIAKRNPSWKTSAICFWPQIGGNVTNKTLSNEHYLRNSSGQFLDPNGSVSSTKWWSPIAPNSSIVADGQKQKNFLILLQNALGRPVTIVNENGEALPIYSRNGNFINNDPAVRADYLSLGYPSTLNVLSTHDYRGRKYADQTKLYRDQFLPAGSSTIFTHYQTNGQIDYTPAWIHARSINHKINGRYYSTSDFYPRWPNNWRGWMSAWHGLGWFADSKYWEEQAGDSLFSPFVCAGWNIDETQNMRPAQYLASLKILSNWGAEFFYSSYFSLSAPFPSPTNWGYQAVIPVYAQAITSRYEPFLRNGYSMTGDVPGNFLGTTLSSDKPKYLFNTGNNRQLVAVRKMRDSEKYIITTAQMVDANTPGNAPNVSYGTFKLGNDSLRVEFRRQGSVYFYDKTANVFYQLDKWHQREHPERWTKDIEIEAEVYDSIVNAQVKTNDIVKNGLRLDMTNTTTSVVLSPSSKIEYNFTPRGKDTTKYSVFFRVKSRDYNVTNTMTLRIDNWTNVNFNCINDTNFVWYKADNLFGSNVNKKFTLTTNGNIEIDKFIVTSNPTLIPNAKTCTTTSTGGSIVKNELQIKCYPTSATEIVYITINHTEDTRGELVVFDSMNRVHYKQRMEVSKNSDNRRILPISNYKSGTYTIAFYYPGGVAYTKFIKNN